MSKARSPSEAESRPESDSSLCRVCNDSESVARVASPAWDGRMPVCEGCKERLQAVGDSTGWAVR